MVKSRTLLAEAAALLNWFPRKCLDCRDQWMDPRVKALYMVILLLMAMTAIFAVFIAAAYDDLALQGRIGVPAAVIVVGYVGWGCIVRRVEKQYGK